MKKVRLFAVAAAMGMFASTVTAAETTTTGYVSTWGSVDEIIKVDVGDKVVAPTATIKVVKETRTTDAEEALDADELGFSIEDIPCYVGNTDVIGEDEKDLGWTDDQVYFIPNGEDTWAEVGFYNSKEEAVEVLLNRGVYLEPGAEEVEDPSYYTLYDGKKFADWEEVLTYAEEEGFVEYVYDEDGEITDIMLNKTEIFDEDDNLKYVTAVKLHLGDSKYAEEEAKKAVVESLVVGYAALTPVNNYWTTTNVVKKNYVTKKDQNTLTYHFDHDDTLVTTDGSDLSDAIATGKVLVVEEDRYGDLLPVEVVTDFTGKYTPYGKQLAGTDGKITVVVKEEAEKDFAIYNGTTVVAEPDYHYTTLLTFEPAKAAQWSAESKMVWDVEVGNFVRVENGFEQQTADLTGFWWKHLVETHEDLPETEATYSTTEVQYGANILGMGKITSSIENDSDKYVITGYKTAYTVTGLSTKDSKMTITIGDTELKLDAVKLEGGWYPAVSSKADLVRVVAKLAGVDEFNGEELVNGLSTANIKNVEDGEDVEEEARPARGTGSYTKWYLATEQANENPWSGFSYEGSLPVTEMRGAESKQCTYKVADGEEVEATVTSNADSVDTSVAGVKTLTLTAKVGEEVVSTKEVKVVVAPKYERTYVNGKVSVLKAFHLNGNLYAEYHYDWAAKTYSATFYQQDGVTVGSTANGTL